MKYDFVSRSPSLPSPPPAAPAPAASTLIVQLPPQETHDSDREIPGGEPATLSIAALHSLCHSDCLRPSLIFFFRENVHQNVRSVNFTRFPETRRISSGCSG